MRRFSIQFGDLGFQIEVKCVQRRKKREFRAPWDFHGGKKHVILILGFCLGFLVLLGWVD
jgi:hypothetical protein